MRNPFTLESLKQSACAKLNPHLELKPVKKKQVRRSSKALRWLETNLHFWAVEKNERLVKEYEFAPGRKYRADWALPDRVIIIEFEGGIFMERGGHNSPAGIQRDIAKYQLAHKLGFTVIRLTATNYTTALQQLDEIIKNK